PWRFTVNRLITEGDTVVTDVTVTDGVQIARAITFSEVLDGRIVRQTEYWPDPFEAPACRARCVERGRVKGIVEVFIVEVFIKEPQGHMTDSRTFTTPTFFFDPTCPWTWMTSRWLVEVAAVRNLNVQWRSISLTILHGGIEATPEQDQEGAHFAQRVQRVIEAMLAAGRNDLVGAFYTAIGTRFHVHREPPSQELLVAAAESSGTAAFLGAADDASWDAAVNTSTQAALRLAGPGIGSPVLAFLDLGRGFSGPIVSPSPTGDDALHLWDGFVTLSKVPSLYELKRSRTNPPQIQKATNP
ncbi:MAG: DsbA family protein, partial [Chloroflexota bacterium]